MPRSNSTRQRTVSHGASAGGSSVAAGRGRHGNAGRSGAANGEPARERKVVALHNVEALNGLRFFSDRRKQCDSRRAKGSAGIIGTHGRLSLPRRQARGTGRGYLRGESKSVQPRQRCCTRRHAAGRRSRIGKRSITLRKAASSTSVRRCEHARRSAPAKACLWGKIFPPMLQELAGRRGRSADGWIIPSAALDACLYAVGMLAWMQVQPGPSLPFRFGRIALGRCRTPAKRAWWKCKFLATRRPLSPTSISLCSAPTATSFCKSAIIASLCSHELVLPHVPPFLATAARALARCYRIGVVLCARVGDDTVARVAHGRSRDDLARPATFLRLNCLGVPLQVRNFEGEIRALSNVLRPSPLPAHLKRSRQRAEHGLPVPRLGIRGRRSNAEDSRAQEFRPIRSRGRSLAAIASSYAARSVFVSLSSEGPSLREYLGDMFDRIADRFGTRLATVS